MTGPLVGIRVLDLTHFVAGPWSTQMLADLGADVVKVEPPGEGEIGRTMGAVYSGGESAIFLAFNRGKRAVVLDLKTPAAQQQLHALARDVDVVVHNFRPGTVDRLGVGADVLRAINPALVYCAISAFGPDGPSAGLPANDPIIQALSGALHETGRATGRPVRMGVSLPDFGAAAIGVTSILAALVRRRVTGKGCLIELNLLDTQLYAQNDLMTGPAHESPTEQEESHRVYLCADGAALVVDCADPDALARAVGVRSDAADDIEQCLAGTARTGALEALARAGITAAPVQELSEAGLNHPARSVRLTHPTVEELVQLRTPFTAEPPWLPSTVPAPLHGEHTASVLGGLSSEHINAAHDQPTRS